MDPIPGLWDIVDEGLQGAFVLDDAKRAAVLDALQGWLADHAYRFDALDPVAGARRVAQIDQFTRRLNRLCAEGGFSLALDTETLRVEILPGGGDAESTLVLLRRGTSWFEGCHELEDLVASAVF